MVETLPTRTSYLALINANSRGSQTVSSYLRCGVTCLSCSKQPSFSSRDRDGWIAIKKGKNTEKSFETTKVNSFRLENLRGRKCVGLGWVDCAVIHRPASLTTATWAQSQSSVQCLLVLLRLSFFSCDTTQKRRKKERNELK